MSLIKKEIVLTDIEVQGLDRMRELNQAFLEENEPSKEVRQFLTEAGSNTDLLLLFLRARKYRPEYAWETLKKKAEVRFDQYPEVYLQKPAKFYEELQEIGLWGMLKNCDRQGCRVICFHGIKWDLNVLKIADITNSVIQLTEKLLLDDKAVENGIVFVVNVEGIGLQYARHFGLSVMLRLINCLWFACPLKVKGVYFLNVPFYLTFLYDLIKPFIPKKLKERFSLTPPRKKFVELHANIDKRILPEHLGGTLGDKEAFEFVKF